MRKAVLLILFLVTSCEQQDENMSLLNIITSGGDNSSEDNSFQLPDNDSVRLFAMTGQSPIQGVNDNSTLDASKVTPNTFADVQIYSRYTGTIADLEIGVNNRNKPTENKHALFPYFAEKASEHFEVPVYVAKHALGGTRIIEHLLSNPDNIVYNTYRNSSLMPCVNQLLTDGKRVFIYPLFGQGWSDGGSQTNIDAYLAKLTEWFNQQKDDFGQDVQILLLETIRDGTIRDQIADIQVQFALDNENVFIVRTNDLTLSGDGIHLIESDNSTIVDRLYAEFKKMTPVEITSALQTKTSPQNTTQGTFDSIS